MGNALKRRHVLFLAIELREAATTTGTYQSQTGKLLPVEPTLEYEVPMYERQTYRRSLTGREPLAGARTGRVKFALELVGSVGPNQFQDVLHCCGMADESVSRLTIGAVTGGPFKHGETITQASSGATGTCVSDTWDGMPYVWLAQDFQFGTGTFDATGTIVGSSSGAQATPTVYDDAIGRAWWPFTPRQSIIQFAAPGILANVSAGDVLKGATSGAVANVFYANTTGATQVVVTLRYGHFTGTEVIQNLTSGSSNIGTTLSPGFEIAIRNCTASIGLIKDIVRERINWARGNTKLSGKIGEPAMFDFEFRGASREPIDQGQDVHPNLSGILVPPVLLGTDVLMGFADDPQSALRSQCIRQFSIDVGNDVQIQECMALSVDHGPFFGPPHDNLTPLGVDMAVIVARNPTITLDPNLNPEAMFPWVDAMFSNRAMRLQMTIGSTAPNKFYLSIPSMVPNTVGGGDFDGISLRNVVLGLDGGQGFGPRGDNELVIIQELR